MLYKNRDEWETTKKRWTDYWKRGNSGRPLMYVIARNGEQEMRYQDALKNGQAYRTYPPELASRDSFDKYRDAKRLVERFRYYAEHHLFLADSFPNISADFGPGSVAGYLGSEISFQNDTVWFEHCVHDWTIHPSLRFDPENKWWKEHYQLIKDIRALAKDDFYVAIPDLMENIDVLASLRGAEPTLYDMIDEPEELAKRIAEVSAVYFEYYNRLYEVVKNEADNGSCYTAFQIWGHGRTAKLQCDFSALMSPQNFRDFIQQPLREQAAKLDNVLYHLDGPDAIKHTDALMEIEEIDSLQWTSGDHGPDGTLEDWDVIYDKVRKAGKSLWIRVYSGEYPDWIRGADRIVKKYGSRGLFLMFQHMSQAEAEHLIEYADKNWSDVEGTFKW
jgi:5-methyltetrahydrofolate--homocysteine methyltransferase